MCVYVCNNKNFFKDFINVAGGEIEEELQQGLQGMM